MNKSSLYASLALITLGVFAIHHHFGNLWPNAAAASLLETAYDIKAAIAGKEVRQDVWKMISLIDKYPAVTTEDERSSVGIIVGNMHATKKAEWWLFYTELVDEPFLLVAAHVDGVAISLCEAGKTECDYTPSNVGGASVLGLTTDQVKVIQAGKELELTFLYRDEFVHTKRSLTGISDHIDTLLATAIVPEESAVPEPEAEEEIIPAWTLHETKDKVLGHIVLIYGPVEEGEVTLSWSSVGYEEQLVPIDNYSGSEVFFKPSIGDIVRLEDVYWDYKGKRTNIVIAEACKKEDKKICVFRGGVSIVMTEQDLVLMQIGRTLVVDWTDESGKLHTSKVLLGSKSHSFNTRINELTKPKDTGGILVIPHTSA